MEYLPIRSAVPEALATIPALVDKTRNSYPSVELLVVITLTRDSNRSHLEKCLKGIGKNLEVIGEHADDEEFWRKIVICVVMDEWDSVDDGDVVDYLVEIGVCSVDKVKEVVVDFKVRVHLFEATVRIREEETAEKRFPPFQIMLALKQEQCGTGLMNCKWWGLAGFANLLKPDYCIVVDAKLVPDANAFHYFISSFKRNPTVGAIVGCFAPRGGVALSNLVMASQQFSMRVLDVMEKSNHFFWFLKKRRNS
jgi:cellulose synthase/poly-beta-1,6-N-acetylglucosamine synthase-like glycosyltransferase